MHIRRPDGQALDAFMHANAFLPLHKGFALVFNPTLSALNQTIKFPLYYTGIADTALFSQEGAPGVARAVARDYSVAFPVALPPQSVTWFLITPGGAAKAGGL